MRSFGFAQDDKKSEIAKIPRAGESVRTFFMRAETIDHLYHAGRPWRTLAALYGPERRTALLGFGFLLIKASPLWVVPVVTANIIDFMTHRTPGGGLGPLWINAAVGAFFIAQNVPSGLLYSIYSSRAIRNVENRLRSALARRLQMLSIAYHSKVSTAVLQTKMLRDVESVEQLSRQLTEPAVGAIVTIIVAVAVTAFRMPVFLPLFALLVPIAAIIRVTLTGKLKRYNQQYRQQLETMNAQVLGMINMIPVTRAHAVEAEEIARVESQFGHVSHAGQNFDRHAGYFGAVAWVSFMLFNLLVLTLAAWLSYRGTVPITAGGVVLLTGYFAAIISAIMQLNAMLPIITRGFDALRSIGEVLECPDIEENRGKLALEGVRGEFRFENVSFSYGEEHQERPAIYDINLEVRAGETIGLAGPSGSGKSTLISLLIGFHRATEGRILLDGCDMKTLDLRAYRQHLSVVTQQTMLFDGTLRENIVYGARDVSEAALSAAVQAANAAEFIDDLPAGLETEIGEGGARLSGGQRQRIAIARALLRNPRVLILDEATSALDAGSEAAVQEALERLMAGRTTFIIAHRLSTLQKADRILVMERGRIVESGTPAELAAQKDGRFATLQRIQRVGA